VIYLSLSAYHHKIACSLVRCTYLNNASCCKSSNLFKSNNLFMMSTDQTGTNASTDSGQGTAPLSDAFITVTTGKRSKRGQSQLVEAPEGSARLSVRRSSRMASSKSQPSQAATPMFPLRMSSGLPLVSNANRVMSIRCFPLFLRNLGLLLRRRVHMGMRVALGTQLYPSWTPWLVRRLSGIVNAQRQVQPPDLHVRHPWSSILPPQPTFPLPTSSNPSVKIAFQQQALHITIVALLHLISTLTSLHR
jgi:hypothetical protein